MGDGVFGTEAGYLLVREIGSIAEDDNMGNPEATYYVLPYELDNLLPTVLGEWYFLNPLGKVVGGHQ